ncbi:MAG: hypothetical protein Q8O89_03230 [Nanoarchaeota archaeon]|nr:hypothetical protein [Nanoarchaeota archaeon]
MKTLVMLTGPRAVGKSTLAGRLIAEMPDFSYLSKVTTREKRPSEGDEEYVFLKKADYNRMLETDEVIFPNVISKDYYGVLSSSFFDNRNKVICTNDLFLVHCLKYKEGFFLAENILGEGHIVKPDPLYSSVYDKVLSIYIDGNKEDLTSRLKKRQYVDGAEEEKLFHQFNLNLAFSYFPDSPFFDYMIHNDNLEKASSELVEIVKREVA